MTRFTLCITIFLAINPRNVNMLIGISLPLQGEDAVCLADFCDVMRCEVLLERLRDFEDTPPAATALDLWHQPLLLSSPSLHQGQTHSGAPLVTRSARRIRIHLHFVISIIDIIVIAVVFKYPIFVRLLLFGCEGVVDNLFCLVAVKARVLDVRLRFPPQTKRWSEPSPAA